MALNPAQIQTLSDDIAINTDPIVVDALTLGDNNAIRAWYNDQASPDYWIFELLLSLDVVGTQLDGEDVANITAANADRLAVFFQVNPGGILPARSDHRAFFDDIFSGALGATTRANLEALWRRLVTYAEQLYVTSTGTGAQNDPDTPTFLGQISLQDVRDAVALIP